MNQRLLLIFLFTLLISSLTFSQKTAGEYLAEKGEVYFKFEITDKADLQNIDNFISIDNIEYPYVYAYANSKGFDQFLSAGFNYSVLPHPGDKEFVRMSSNPEEIKSWDYYPTYDAYVEMMYQFATDFPEICRIENIGQTHDGRDLLFAVISDNISQKEAEAQFMYTGTMHGDETTGYVLMLRLIDYLLNNYGSNAEITELVDNLEIWINPLANPDGTYAGGNNSVNGATRYNANYVDINRNFPDIIDGPHPDGNDWQLETIAMMDIAEANNFVMSANFHGGTEVLNYPWDTMPELHADDSWFRLICREYADTVHLHAPSSYMNGYDNGITNGYAWYEADGTRQDYMTYFRHCREVTMEISDTKLLSASLLPAHWEYNRASFINYLQQAMNGVTGIVTGIAGQPIKAEVIIEGHDFDNSTVFSDSLTGNYHRLIKSGTYDITFEAPDYFSKEITGVQVIDGQSTILDVQLISMFGTPDTVAPTTITDLAHSESTSNSVTLTWSAPMDTSAGGVISYDIRMSEAPIQNEDDFNNAQQIPWSGDPLPAGEMESLTVNSLEFATEYYFAVKSHDIWQNFSEMSNIVSAGTWEAPSLGIDPTAYNIEANINTIVYDTLTISNVSSVPSTLDFLLELEAPGDIFKIAGAKIVAGDLLTDRMEKKGFTENVAGIKGSGGPDQFGYDWIDSDEPDGPEYEWTDISSTGTMLDNWTQTGTYSAKDEGYAGPVVPDFAFPFYGMDKEEIYVSSNGLLTFAPITENVFSNSSIPSSGYPDDIVAPFWDDLDGKTTGEVYYQNYSDKTVIQYDNWATYSGTSSLTFQIVLYKSGKIVYYYNSMSGTLTSSTVGIENNDGSIGLMPAYNTSYVKNEFAVQFSFMPEWLSLNNMEGTIYNGASVEVILEINTEGLSEDLYNMNIQLATNDPDNLNVTIPVNLNVGSTGILTSTLNLSEGWNMLSVPLSTADMNASSLFPQAVSPAFSFNDGYIMNEVLENGLGYWLKFDASQSVNISGIAPAGNIELLEGWNLIGIYNDEISASSISTNPQGIIISEFFGFNSGYSQADQLMPGEGYWVKTSEAGEILMAPSKRAINSGVIKENIELASLLKFTDASGRTYSLGVTESQIEKISELPPLPPRGVMDIRFMNNKNRANLNDGPANFRFSSVKFPLKIQITGKALRLKGLNNQPEKIITLADGDYISISETEAAGLQIESVSLPTEFALQQNYPNPFNPETNISFSLPAESDVSLVIYDILGSRVKTLINKKLIAGNYSVKFNAGDLSSGIYFYHLSASDYSDIKKMILIK